METKTVRSKYYQKAIDSFKTRLNFLLFNRILEKQSVDNLTIDDFEKFQITDDLIKLYATKYYQLEVDKELVNGITVNFIYENILNYWKKKEESENHEALKMHYWIKMFPKMFPFEKFQNLFDEDKNEQKCHYCHVTVKMIDLLRSKQEIYQKRDNRGFTMEIDRIEANKEYTTENSVLCCYWCNNAKTDEFTRSEFEIIRDGIRKVWNQRLKQYTIELIPDPVR